MPLSALILLFAGIFPIIVWFIKIRKREFAMTQPLVSKTWSKFFIRENWNQIVPIAIIGAAFSFFVISTVNYRNETWFLWLITSRIFMGSLGVFLVFWLFTHKVGYPWIETAYITLGLAVQASHGILESATSIEFY